MTASRRSAFPAVGRSPCSSTTSTPARVRPFPPTSRISTPRWAPAGTTGTPAFRRSRSARSRSGSTTFSGSWCLTCERRDMDFSHFVQLIAIGLQARIPMHITGFPGVGKTEFTKSLEAGFTRAGIKCKVLILVGSIREPQDFGGFPVSTPDGVRLLPMAWARDAKRLAEDGYLVIVFLDELTTVPPTTQAAMLRLLTENVCGELQLPDYEPGKGGVVYLCASNAVEWAAGGQEIQAPMANRLWHGEFPMDYDTWCDMMVSDFPAPSDLPVRPGEEQRTYLQSQ